MNYGDIKNFIKENEPDWEAYFYECKNGFAILQMSDDISEKRGVHFFKHETAVKNLGRPFKREDYAMLQVEELSEEQIAEIKGEKSNLGGITAICEYVFEEYNKSSRRGIEEGYYGTSLSVSDIILVKENKEIYPMYVEPFGFKKLEDFSPYRFINESLQVGEYFRENDEVVKLPVNIAYAICSLADEINAPHQAMDIYQGDRQSRLIGIDATLPESKPLLDAVHNFQKAFAGYNETELGQRKYYRVANSLSKAEIKKIFETGKLPDKQYER